MMAFASKPMQRARMVKARVMHMERLVDRILAGMKTGWRALVLPEVPLGVITGQ